MLSDEAVEHNLIFKRNKAGTTRSASCPNSKCANHHRNDADLHLWAVNYGKTAGGVKRYRCTACRKVFSIKTPFARVQQRSKNTGIVTSLTENGRIRSVQRTSELGADAIYSRIDQIHRQFVLFERLRILDLPLVATDRFRIASDFQDYLLNWQTKDDRRPIQLSCLYSVDIASSYVFGGDLNFEPVPDFREHFFRHYTEFAKPEPRRSVAAYDTSAFIRSNWAAARRAEDDEWLEAVAKIAQQPDVAVTDEEDADPIGFRLPYDGHLLDRTHLATAHFIDLIRILPENARVDFFSDMDGSILRAIRAAALDGLGSGRFRYAFIDFTKGLKIDKKRELEGEALQDLRSFKKNELVKISAHLAASEALKGLDSYRLRMEWIKARLRPALRGPNYSGSLLQTPISTSAEPDKRIAPLYPPLDPAKPADREIIAELAMAGSMQRLDSFFARMRNRVSFIGRGVSRPGMQTWYLSAAYSGTMLQKLIDIARIYFNYCEPTKRKPPRFDLDSRDRIERTPAQRLGLAKGRIRLSEILNEHHEQILVERLQRRGNSLPPWPF